MATLRPDRDAARPPAQVVAASELPDGDVWQKIFAAGQSAKRNSQAWLPYQPNLPQDLYDTLQDRIAADKIRTGDFDLAVNHYLEVAVSLMPTAADGRIDAAAVHDAGFAWLTSHPRAPEGRAATGSRLMHQTKLRMRILVGDLKRIRPKIPVWMVIAAYVEQLLEDLSETAPPER